VIPPVAQTTLSHPALPVEHQKGIHRFSPMKMPRGMENGEWRMENGEWGMGNGEWRMENGEWGMGNGEWGMGESGFFFTSRSCAFA